MTAMTEPIYLDHNATTPIHPEVRAAMISAIDVAWGNPSSGHAIGRRAHDAIEGARAEVAALIGAAPEEIVFTSGGTEASNLAILGTTREGAIVRSAIEHPATREPCAHLASRGRAVRVVGVDRNGVIDLAELARSVVGAALVSVMHANNETGVIQPIAELARIARAATALVHTDAAQSIGKIEVDVRELDVDLLTLAGHKLYAPKGVGALYVRAGVTLAPLFYGASHERGMRPGTENVVGIVGLGAACSLAQKDLERESGRVRRLRDRLIDALKDGVPGLVVHGELAPRLPNTASVRFPRASGPRLLASVPEIAASTGAACHAQSEAASAVIAAMGVAPDAALGTVRLSLGRSTTESEIDAAARLLVTRWRQLARE